jgi:L-rhamnose isomerase
MKKELTKQQEAEIYCVKHGHANYVWKFWGYVHCGRCGSQIGDQLGSVFDTRNLIVMGCKDSPCDVCDPLIKKLSPLDQKIFKIMNTAYKADHSMDVDKLLKSIDFEEENKPTGGN